MKKLAYIATMVCGLTLAGTSCVDLDQEPQSFITEEDYFETMDVKAIEQAASGLYNNLWAQNYGFNCRVQRMNVCADDITYRAAKANNPLALYDRLSPNTIENAQDLDISWSLFFTVINNANKLINKTKAPSNPEDAKKYNEVIGEAYFLRGLSYFYLVRIFGDVPLILKDEDASLHMPRTAVATVYEQGIIPSLKEAARLLPSKSRSGFSSTPSLWAAKACLADAYMTMAGWPLKKGTEYYKLAATTAEEIIDHAGEAGLKLTASYADLWKEANKEQANEIMFALHHSAKMKTASNYGTSYYPSDFAPNAGWADYYANEAFYLKYPDDTRKEWNFMTQWNTKNGMVTYQQSADKLPAISKYYDYNEGAPGKSAQANGITCIYRYAEVLLMYAEASTRANNTVSEKALEQLQEVQKRAQGYPENPTLTETTDPQAFLKAVSDERGWEFFAEMKRWFELVRLEKVSEVKQAQWNGSIFQSFNHYYFPIPHQQIELTGWQNNPGY